MALLLALLLLMAPPNPKETAVTVSKTAFTLDALAKSGKSDLALDAVPAFIASYGGRYAPSGFGERTPSPFSQPEHRPALRALVSDDGVIPRTKAVAVLWLAAFKDPQDVAVIEALVGSHEDAGRFPCFSIGQQARLTYPVQWEAHTLGDIALVALGVLTGTPFRDAAAWTAWRSKNADPGRGYDFWSAVANSDDGDRGPRLATLRKDDPDLYLRVVILAHGEAKPSDVGGADPAAKGGDAALVKERLGSKGLLALLRGENSWPELADEENRDRLLVWSMQRSEILFAPGDAGALLALWKIRDLGGKNTREAAGRDLKGSQAKGTAALAVAAARANPAERRQILETTVQAMPYVRGPVLRELATCCREESLPLLKKYFLAPETIHVEDDRVAILEGLGSLGPSAKPALRAIAGGFTTDSASVVRALAAAAKAMGATIALPPDRDYLYVPLKSPRRDRAVEAEHLRGEENAAKARRDAVQRIQSWLRE